uniref:HECT-type E3 ubiquitin transferase n=1 Tax=Syphacia muris TaxID=451379 RepID=A0A158R3Z5_9BILA
MNLPEDDQRTVFINRLTAERKERETRRKQEDFFTTLQAACRGYLARKLFSKAVRNEFDELLSSFTDLDKERELPECRSVLKVGFLFLRNSSCLRDIERYLKLCRYLIVSVSITNLQCSFPSLFLSKNYIQRSNNFILKLFINVCGLIGNLKLTKVADGKALSIFVLLMVTYSNCNSWALVRNNQKICLVLNSMCSKITCTVFLDPQNYSLLSSCLCKMVSDGRLLVPSPTLNGLFTLLFRAVKDVNFNASEFILFIKECLTCPALITHLSPASIDLLLTNDVFGLCLTALLNSNDIFAILTGNESLFLLANLTHLCAMNLERLIECLIDWTEVVGRLLSRCDDFILRNKDTCSHWHPIFGWYCQPVPHGQVLCSNEGALPLVIMQLKNLWSKPVIKCLFKDVLHSSTSTERTTVSKLSSDSQSDLTLSIQKLWKKLNSIRADTKLASQAQRLPELSIIVIVCQVYQRAMHTFSTLSSDITAGLCREDFLLPHLFTYIVSFSPADNGLTYVLNLLSSHSDNISHFAPLILFANCAATVISILDEDEMYEQEKPFTLEQLRTLAKFCNHFCFRVIWKSYMEINDAINSPLFSSLYQLCMLLYNRDCRRSFTSEIPKFWLAPYDFLSER